jgi:hypothetical protein
MRPERAGLDRTQRWMQAMILEPGPVEEAIAAPHPSAEVPAGSAAAMILPSKTLQPLERLDVYREMYEARLIEALESDYPSLAHFLGEETFAELTHLYISENPSRSYTLNVFGATLTEFIGGVDGLKRRDFVQDLARFEWTQTKVFDDPQTEPLSAEAIAAVPADAWENARLKPVSAFRLIELRYPVHRYTEAVREERTPPVIRRKRTWLAVFRRDYALFHIELERQGYDILSALSSGQTLGESIRAARMLSNSKKLTKWFSQWTGEGVFQSVELS